MYGIVKVLVIERGVVHVRVYREKFSKRPESIDATVLTLGSVDGGGDFGMGHLPLSDASFATWVPVPIHNEPVADAELAGYRMWQDHSGGVW